MATCLLSAFFTSALAYPVTEFPPMGSLSEKTYHLDVLGRVVDANGQPIPGAKVRVKFGKAATITDVDGRFNIKGWLILMS